MCRSGAIVLFVAPLLLGLVACGGGGAAAKPLPLKARVLKRGEFPGFTPGTPILVNSAKAYFGRLSGVTPSQRTAWIARFTREGFKRDATEFLRGAYGAQALSGVMQFGSAASARGELEAELRFWEAQGATPFSVRAISGAAGYDLTSISSSGENVLFTDGPFLYFVGYGWYGSAHNPKHAALIEAAAKLYKRVHGHLAS